MSRSSTVGRHRTCSGLSRRPFTRLASHLVPTPVGEQRPQGLRALGAERVLEVGEHGPGLPGEGAASVS